MTSAYNYNRLLSAYPLLGAYFYPDRAISASPHGNRLTPISFLDIHLQRKSTVTAMWLSLWQEGKQTT